MENSLYYYLPPVGYALCLLFALAWKAAPAAAHRGMTWSAIATPLVLSLLSAWLVATFALSTRWTVLGIFQSNDAHDFLTSIADVVRQGWFDTPRGRPLANLSWAGLLDLSGFDVAAAGYLAAGFSAVAIMAVAVAAYGIYPAWAALLTAVFLFDYFHEFFMGISSEMPGFAFGCAAAAALFQAARTRSAVWFLCGLALFTGGMLVRPGVMFLLPMLLIWGVWWFARGLKGRATLALAGLAVIAALFAVNGRVAATITPHSGGTFVNAADSWYAIFENGREALGIPPKTERLAATRWRQIYVDHPEIETLPRPEQAARKKEIILRQLSDYPLAGLVGAALELKDQFVEAKLFRFVEAKPLRYLTYVFFLIGAAAGLRRAFRDPVNSLHAAIIVTTVAAVPFMFGGESRGFAASVGLMAMTVAYGATLFLHGAAGLVRKALRRAPNGDPTPAEATGPVPSTVALVPLVLLPALFLAIAIVDGVLLASSSRAGLPVAGAAACPAGETAIRVVLRAGSRVTIVPEGSEAAGTRVFTPATLQAHLDWQTALATEKARWRYVSTNIDGTPFNRVVGLVRETGRAYTIQQAIDVRGIGLLNVIAAEPQGSALSAGGPVDICAVVGDGTALVRPPAS